MASAAAVRCASTLRGGSSSWCAAMALTTMSSSPALRAICAPMTAWPPSTSWVTALPMSWRSPARLASFGLMPISCASSPHMCATSTECRRMFCAYE